MQEKRSARSGLLRRNRFGRFGFSWTVKVVCVTMRSSIWRSTANFVLAAAFASTGTYRTILAADIQVSMSLAILVNLSAARLRQKEPNLQRPFRMPLFPLPVAIAIAVNLALLAALIFDDILHSLEGFKFLGSIGLIYLAVR